MTTIQLISDIHTEFHRDEGRSFIDNLPNDIADVLIVAGDLTVWRLLEKNIIQLCSRFPEVIYVSGNHEYYGSDFQKVDNTLRVLQSQLDNFHWLDDSVVEIHGQRFIGCTLWFEEDNISKNPSVKACLNDFNRIWDCDPIAFHKCDASMRYLAANIQEGDIVVTHHMPSYDCVHPRYKNSLLNCYFAVEMRKVILDTKPKIWCYGHTHIAGEFKIGETRMICNPLGYPHEQNDFDDYHVVTI